MTRYKDLLAEGEGKEVKRISIDLPIDLIDGVDRLRKEWGFRARGLVFERLLEVILSNDLDYICFTDREVSSKTWKVNFWPPTQKMAKT